MRGEFRMQASSCPTCGHFFDAATNATGNERPAPGDFTVCIECAGVFVFDAAFQVKQLTPANEAELEKNPELASSIRKAQNAVRLLRRIQ